MSSPTDKFVKITSVNKQLDQAITDGDVTTKTVAATLSNKTLDDSNTINVNETKLTLEKDGDPTAQAQFTLVNISSATIRRMELPDQDTSLVGTDVSQTLSQKTLDYTNTINIKDTNLTVQSSGDDTRKVRLSASSVSAGTTRTLTAPDANTTIVGTDVAQTLTNKTLNNTNIITVKAPNLTVQDGTDTTKQVKLDASAVTTGTTRTLTVPDASTTIVGTGITQTLSNKTLDNTSTITVKAANLTVQDATDTTKQIKLDASAVTTGTTRTLTAPDANTTIVGTDTTQTLSNKTLDDTSIVTVKGSNLTIEDATDVTKAIRFSAASITTGQRRILTAPDANTTIVGTGVAQTLTNKTVGDALTLTQIATPSSPSSGLNKIYTKSDNSLYLLNSSGTETIIGGTAKSPTTQRFTSGSGTYTTPAGVLYIQVVMVGGGGGGAGGGAGSGAGNGGAGGAGGNTTFGSNAANGGAGGIGGYGGQGGSGGTTTIAAGAQGIGFTGARGATGNQLQTAYAPAGAGGSSAFGGAGPNGAGSTGFAAAANTGSGGGGGSTNATSGTNQAGGGGGAGGYLDIIINSPSPTYSYAVGSAGTAGTAGANGFDGGAGVAGYIEVREYYPSTPGASTETVNAQYSFVAAATPIPNGANTTITTTYATYTKVTDSHNAFSSGVYTVPISGTYSVTASSSYVVNGTGIRSTLIQQGGSSSALAVTQYIPNGTNVINFPVTTLLKCLTGDTISIQTYQSSGGTLALNGNSYQNWVSINRVGS